MSLTRPISSLKSAVIAPTTKLPIWHSLDIERTIDLLESDREQGLSAAQVTAKKARFGANKLSAKKGKPWWLKFLLQFNQPLLLILLSAGVIKALLQEWVNAGVIWGVTTTNATISFIQESKAEGAIAALASSIQTEATVIRDHKKLRIPSRELVPGDIVLLTSGDKVPADLRLIQVRNLQIDESSLTGESVAVEKDSDLVEPETPLAERLNMAYAGAFVTFGQGTGIVIAIGQETQTGQIAQLIEQRTDLTTPLTRKFNAFSQNWLYMVLGLATLTFAVGLGHKPWSDAIEAAVALTVSAIPEGLPAVITVTLAVSVSRMARRHAIICKLPAVETLGSATVICSDKTATLTENQMTVQEIYAGGQNYTVSGVGYNPEGEIFFNSAIAILSPALLECLKAGLLCNDSNLEAKNGKWEVIGDLTEGALIAAANKAGLTQEVLEMPRLDSIPFESQFQYMVTLHEQGSGKKGNSALRTIYVKGSVETILNRCQQMLDPDGQPIVVNREQIEQEVNNLAKQELRVLAFAQKPVATYQDSVDHRDIETGLIFLGLQGMIDPPRPAAIARSTSLPVCGYSSKDDYWRSRGDCTGDRASNWFEKE